MSPEWRAWYTDDRTFDSGDTAWASLPYDGVLGIRVFGELESAAIYGFDHYFYAPETGLIAGSDDPIEEIARRYPGAIVRRGKWIPLDDWVDVRREIQRYD